MNGTGSNRPARPMSSWEKNLLGVRLEELPRVLTGLVTATVLAWASIWLSDYIGCQVMGYPKTPISSVTVAILLGLVIGNAISQPEALKAGLTFVVKKVLPLGIIFLGMGLSVLDVLRLGAMGIPIVMVCILAALFVTTRLSARLQLPERLGTLIAVGTSICGVSAIVAMGPAIDASDEEVAYAVSVITIFGLFATLVYPYAANWMFRGDPVRAGLFLGTAIHDTSQVTGAALVYSDLYGLPRGLDVATVTKLVRNVFMAAVIPLMAYSHARQSTKSTPVQGGNPHIVNLLPRFVLGFLGLALFRSIGDASLQAGGRALVIWDATAWAAMVSSFKQAAVTLLVIALAGVGLNTRIRVLRGLGGKPFLVGLGAALVVGLISLLSILLLGSFIAS